MMFGNFWVDSLLSDCAFVCQPKRMKKVGLAIVLVFTNQQTTEVKLVLQKRLREAEQQLQRLARKAEAKFEAHRAACRRAEKQSKAIKVDVDVDHQRRATQEEDDEWTVIENSEELRRSTMEMLRQEMLLCVPDQTLKTKLMATVAKLRERLDKSTAAEFYLSDDSD